MGEATFLSIKPADKKYTVGLSFSNSSLIQPARLILVEEKF